MIWRLRWYLIQLLAWGQPVMMNFDYAGYIIPKGDKLQPKTFRWNVEQRPFKEKRGRS